MLPLQYKKKTWVLWCNELFSHPLLLSHCSSSVSLSLSLSLFLWLIVISYGNGAIFYTHDAVIEHRWLWLRNGRCFYANLTGYQHDVASKGVE